MFILNKDIKRRYANCEIEREEFMNRKRDSY